MKDFKENIGEIVYFNRFNVLTLGKDRNGEYNGQIYSFPNYKFFIGVIKKEDIKKIVIKDII